MNEHFPQIDSVVTGRSGSRIRYTDRPYHAIIFKKNGMSRYTFDSAEFVLHPGTALFIPQGSCYLVEKLSHGDSYYALINFSGASPFPAPALFSLSGFPEEPFLSEFPALWFQNDRMSFFRCYEKFAQLLSFLSAAEEPDIAAKERIRLIEPGLTFLSGHIFEPDFRIGDLWKQCRISDTYFRRLFSEAFGMTPKTYVRVKRLERAALLLKNGECSTVSDAAFSVGYTDPLYFSRLFRQHFGTPPSGFDR